MIEITRELEAILLVKATPQLSRYYDGSLCCSGVTPAGEWLRIYLKPSQSLEYIQQLGRWTRIRFRGRPSAGDSRPESRDIDVDSFKKIGELTQGERHQFLSKLEVTSLSAIGQGRSLALVRPRFPRFSFERKTKEKLAVEQENYDFSLAKAAELSLGIRLQKPCPYTFKYAYSLGDTNYESICEDGGINSAFLTLSQSVGETKALMRIIQLLGNEYPAKGMHFAMGTNPAVPEEWLIHSIIGMDEVYHMAGQWADVVA